MQFLGDLISETAVERFVSSKGVVMYGLCISLAGHYVGWTVSLYAGFWEVFGCTFVILTSTGCLMLCIAEMTSALPFSGGTYGVVRVTLGHLPGYLVGTCEALQNVLYVSLSVGTLSKYITLMTDYDEKFEPLYWVVFYLTIGIISSNHRTLFWRSMWMFGVFMCVMLLLYCTTTRAEDVNFAKYTKDPAVTNVPYHEEVYHFFQQLPLPSFFFNLSIKPLQLACRESMNPTSDVPIAMYIVYALSIVSAYSILFCASSIAPGVSVLRNFPAAPLSFGFSSIFNISMEQAVVFTMFSLYASCLGFTFAFTQQMAALSKSGFLWNSRKWGFVPDRYDNVVSLLVGCGFGYLLNVLIFALWEDIRLYAVTLFRLLDYSINLVVFVTYIVFHNQFHALMTKFPSPLGVPGAVYGMLVYWVVWGCIGALSDVSNHWLPFVLLACFLLLWSLPFFLYYRYHLAFSQEESTVMFIAYVIKANKERRMRRLHSPKSRSYTSFERKTPTERTVVLESIADEKKKNDEEEDSPSDEVVRRRQRFEMNGMYSAANHGLKMEYVTRDMSHSIDETVATGSTHYTGVPYVGPSLQSSTHIPLHPPHPDCPEQIIRDAPVNRQQGLPVSPRQRQRVVWMKSPGKERVAPISPEAVNPEEPFPMPTTVYESNIPQQQVSLPISRVNSCAESLDSVLVTELGYELNILGHYHTEIEEYFASEAAAEEEEGLEQLHSQGDDAV